MYLLDEQDKEELTDIWKSKDIEMPLSEFIEKYSKSSYLKNKERQSQSLEKDKEAIALAENILNIGGKGGRE